MRNKMQFIVIGIIILLLVAAILSVVYMNNRFDVFEDVSELKGYAEELHQTGDIDGAISSMETYVSYVTTDVEAITLLGDWYYESGNKENAYASYYQAALNKRLIDENVPSLSVKNTEEILLEPVSRVNIEITPDVRMTKDMTLMITSHNLVPDEIKAGRIVELNEPLEEEERYYTTDWFEIDPEGEYLTMSGGFNYAIWQFKNKYGVITHSAESPNSYRRNDTYDVDIYQMARAVIPDESKWCRVTYYDKNLENETASIDEKLTIVYGRLPGESKAADFSYYEIPDLKEGEKIVYDGEWTMISNGETTPLSDWKLPSIERGSYFSIDGILPGRVSFENCQYADFDKAGIYTIRFDSETPSAMGERMDDAKNLGFNASVADATIALGENHFDNIYPWTDIKMCNIINGEVVAYEGDSSFTHDGSNGDVFVEIPKFYVKRIVDDRYDTISISGVKHEGFEVDEAFLTKNGEADKIYIAAYLTSTEDGNVAKSIADTNPVLNLTPQELNKKASEKGEGYKEVDYAAISALQKLFMVETGLRNSQYLYMGCCAYTIASANINNSEYATAVYDSMKSNCINVSSKYYFKEGNSVIIFDTVDYDNTVSSKNIRKIRTVIDNGNDTQSVYFEGEPMNIVANRTAVAHTALENGTTRSVGGHTGAMNTERGTVSFKYRNIENLWGNVYVYVDGVRIVNNEVTLTDRSGNIKKLGYNLPEIKSQNTIDNMIKKVGYDPENPQVMLPIEIGGATTSTYYGDAYLSNAEADKEYVLHFGGGWSSKACAGLFSVVASSTADETFTNTSGRMMIVK